MTDISISALKKGDVLSLVHSLLDKVERDTLAKKGSAMNFHQAACLELGISEASSASEVQAGITALRAKADRADGLMRQGHKVSASKSGAFDRAPDDRKELHDAICAYAEQNGCDYMEALNAVTT